MPNKFVVPEHPASLRLNLIVYMSIRNLWFKRFRSALTLVGVVIGIGSIFLLLSFGIGLQSLVQKQIVGSKSINVIDVSTLKSKILKLDEDSLNRLKSLPNVKSISAVYSSAAKAKLGDATADVVVYGVDSQYFSLNSLSLTEGTAMRDNQPDDLIINRSLLEAIGAKDAKAALDQPVTLTLQLSDSNNPERQFRIRGVVDSGSGSEIFVPQSVFQEAGQTSFSQLKIVVNDRQHIADLRKQIESIGFTTESPIDTLDQINQVFRFFNVILVGFGSIGMVIAILGMLNTLTVSLLERTQEIALMISLGGRPNDMRRLFKAESVILSLVGGSLGILLAVVTGATINLVMNQLARGRGVEDSFSLFATPLWLIAVMLLFMTLVGLAVAYVPARRAANIHPVDALRHE